MLSDNINLFVCFILILLISVSRKKELNTLCKIGFLIFSIFVFKYNKTIGILFFISYAILFSYNSEHIFESFSTKKEDGFHDLNNVLKFLKGKKSKKILETMFSDKKE